METRRDFLRLAGLAVASGVPGCATGPSPGRWTSGDLEYLEAATGHNGSRGWAAWEGSRQIAASDPYARGTAYSITKSLATLAATKAAAAGWLSASERVADTISEWRGDTLKSEITVLMLLQQVSGLESGVVSLYRNQPREKGKVAAALNCINTPGSVFRYGPGHWELLAEVVRRKLAAKDGSTLLHFMKKEVMNPIGLNSAGWRSDTRDVPYFSTGTELSAIELGRLGDTVSSLLSGKNSTGFSAGKFAEMTRPSAVNPIFCGGLWRNSNATRPDAAVIEIEDHLNNPLPASFWSRACLSKRQPADFTALIGSSGRRVYIWPGEKKRIARLGPSRSWSDSRFLAGL